MTRRYIHYESAFEDYLRSRGVAYVPVDEHRKVIFSGGRVKSFDFLVYRPGGETWIVDVKGRKFPYDYDAGGGRPRKRYWENWVAEEDIDGLGRWQAAFGPPFLSVIVFAYWLTTDGKPPTAELHPYRDELYAFLSVRLDDFRRYCRPRSDKWGTVSMSASTFKRLAVPIQTEPRP